MERSLKQYEEVRKEAAIIAAKLILASAVTSPRLGGVGEIAIQLFDDDADIEDICIKMEEMSDVNPAWKSFKRDAAMLRDADVLLIMSSLRSFTDPADVNCNYCGYVTCEYMKEAEKLPKEPDVAFRGPLCFLRSDNVAFALDGGISLARNLGIDYGVFWSAGAAAMKMELLPNKTGLALGLALSVTEKSPFRDIPIRYDEINERTMTDRVIKRLYPQFRSIYS
jgi:uncharacterized ferredoxin-like protein